MKLYVLGINNNNIDIATIENYKFNETVCKYIFSNEGIYQYTDNSLKKMIILDEPTHLKTVENGVEILCDTSKFVTGPDWYQLPISCVEDSIKNTYFVYNQTHWLHWLLKLRQSLIKFHLSILKPPILKFRTGLKKILFRF